jgi:hypothetical protein
MPATRTHQPQIGTAALVAILVVAVLVLCIFFLLAEWYRRWRSSIQAGTPVVPELSQPLGQECGVIRAYRRSMNHGVAQEV